MYSEGGTPEYFLDQNHGFYYPTPTPTPAAATTNYAAYICTGFESPTKWDDIDHHRRSFGLDGQELQYATVQGSQTENFPFLYYTPPPTYGYGHSPYNPYNPYIPGAFLGVGVDGPFLGTPAPAPAPAPHYYTLPPSYDSSLYFPPQSSSDLLTNNTTEPSIHTKSSSATANRPIAPLTLLNQNLSSPSTTLLGPPASSNKTNSFTRLSHGIQTNPVSTKRPTPHGNVTSSALPRPSPNQILQQGGGSQLPDYMLPRGKAFPSHSQLKVTLPRRNGLSSFGSAMHGQHTADKLQSKFLNGRAVDDTKIRTDALLQNRGPRIDKSKNQLTVRAYTTRAGDADMQGNIVINTDRYNKLDFHVDYTSAKFFVIKSYSEDDVHKSIKYNVWSSTPNGNKKLNNAYEDAQRIANRDSGDCPIFLCFSVNASSQFCGVAQMAGPVDFHKDMDFWQQDKWSGSFPVKWHIIKDVPNPCFRHIILENNENKPVTNSRDTQEVRYRKGIEMLKIFKNYVSKTSLLDDFMYYENRQKILLEESSRARARAVIRNYEYPFLVPVLDPPQKLNSIIDLPAEVDDETKHKESNISDKDVAASVEMVGLDGNTKSYNTAKESRVVGVLEGEARDDNVINVGNIDIPGKQSGSEVREVSSSCGSTDVMTIGSMAVKVNNNNNNNNGFEDSSDFLTFGSIDPRAVQQKQLGGTKNG